jgi:dTDP-4-amino-4,6-dideoxygalactose transaminase
LQAAMLRVKLRALDAENARRKEIAARYLDGLRGANVILPTVPDWADPVWHLFVVRHADRDGLAARLKADGIATMIHYPVPPHLQPAYRDAGYAEGSLPLTERIHREVLSLPIGPALSNDEVERVIDAVHRHA